MFCSGIVIVCFVDLLRWISKLLFIYFLLVKE